MGSSVVQSDGGKQGCAANGVEILTGWKVTGPDAFELGWDARTGYSEGVQGARGASPTHRGRRRDFRDSGGADGLRRRLGSAAPPDGGSGTHTTGSPGAGARANRPAATTAGASASDGRAGRSPDAVSVPATHV